MQSYLLQTLPTNQQQQISLLQCQCISEGGLAGVLGFEISDLCSKFS